MNKGKLITFYGINNIGKSTHARLLVDHLNRLGVKARHIKYPIYDLKPTSPEINNILRGENSQKISEEELQTLFMRNREDFENQLKNLLDDGYMVLAEDYSGTGIAWGTAKGLDKQWVQNLNAHLLKEDYTILLTGQRSMVSKEHNHLHEKNDELVEKVARVLSEMAEENGWDIVEVQPRIEDTEKLIFDKVKNFLGI